MNWDDVERYKRQNIWEQDITTFWKRSTNREFDRRTKRLTNKILTDKKFDSRFYEMGNEPSDQKSIKIINQHEYRRNRHIIWRATIGVTWQKSLTLIGQKDLSKWRLHNGRQDSSKKRPSYVNILSIGRFVDLFHINILVDLFVCRRKHWVCKCRNQN